jgi:DNA-binding NtrC family response regulator
MSQRDALSGASDGSQPRSGSAADARPGSTVATHTVPAAHDRPHSLRTEAQVSGYATTIDLPRVRLVVLEGPDQGAFCDSDDELLVRVGTRENNRLLLSDKSVSGYHLEIARSPGSPGGGGGWRLRDLGSTNGTFVGGLRIYDIQVRSGTVISIGRSKLRLEALDDEPVRAALHPAGRFGDMVGHSVPMRRLFSRITQVAASTATVLIAGETGTGKEAVAEALVQAGPRASAPFVVIDCSALPGNLIESELFGHVKGAFTGAHSDYRGAFERADGGTVFLDEIGELPLDLQPKLLRVLERREVRRVGSERTRPIDVRVVAATNRALASEVNEGRFRQDLYFRLSVVNLHIPPLRERREDIPLLIEHFYNQLIARHPGKGRVPSLSEISDRLLGSSSQGSGSDYAWPGNVRELRNAVERAFHVPDEDPVVAIPRPPDPRDSIDGRRAGSSSGSPAADELTLPPFAIDLAVPFKTAKQKLIDGFEKRYLAALLKAARGNISEAARRAQLDRMHLYKLITQHRLNQPD